MAIFASSTQQIPDAPDVPRHVAMIMDGNGRWAKKRLMPRIMGHKRGVETVRDVVRQCIDMGIEYLTLFAFSSENWRRPPDEVKFLMGLFMEALGREAKKLHHNQVRLIIIGDRSRFDPALIQAIEAAEDLTKDNTRLTLTIAANYGGRWDVTQATIRMLRDHPELIEHFDETDMAPYLSMHYAPEP
ncbi:MAG TPA: polyprenyl diphosphate synthase, partial [Methylophilaceae bacterium]